MDRLITGGLDGRGGGTERRGGLWWLIMLAAAREMLAEVWLAFSRCELSFDIVARREAVLRPGILQRKGLKRSKSLWYDWH